MDGKVDRTVKWTGRQSGPMAFGMAPLDVFGVFGMARPPNPDPATLPAVCNRSMITSNRVGGHVPRRAPPDSAAYFGKGSRPAFVGNLGTTSGNDTDAKAGPNASSSARRSSGCTALALEAIL